ncbi:MAG: ABC transporter substrate-binding protein [Desulfobaccales bacterium]
MKIFNVKNRLPVLGVVICLVTAGFLANSAFASSMVTVVDFHGRSVTLKTPVERIVLLESSYAHEVAAILGDDFAAKIVGWDDSFRRYGGDGHARFMEKIPQLKNVPEVGNVFDGTINVEKILMLKPDVVIAHEFMFLCAGDETNAVLARLEQAGIPVLCIDYYMHPLQNSTQSTLLLGKILGQEARARALADFYNHQVNRIFSRLRDIHTPKPKVYLECAYEGPGAYGVSYGDLAWGSIIKKCGGNNIGEPVLGNQLQPLSPEYVIQQDPDVIILTGRNYETPGSVKMGYLASPESVRQVLQAFLGRPGWNLLNAVKNRKVYSIYHSYGFSIYSFAAVQAFAKWFYPEAFKDIDPIATLKEYHEKFMPIDYSGTFVFSYF